MSVYCSFFSRGFKGTRITDAGLAFLAPVLSRLDAINLQGNVGIKEASSLQLVLDFYNRFPHINIDVRGSGTSACLFVCASSRRK